jgi:putative SOS response-associated peptidase YedK
MITNLSAVADLLDAAPEPRFDAYEVTTAVNDHRNNGPQLVSRIAG